MKPADVHEFFSRLRAANPAPETELVYSNPYTLLVAVVLSAQATDIGVNRATKDLFKKVKTPQAMIRLGLAGLKAHIRTIGLYNAKAANVMALSQRLVDEFDSQVPDTREALMSLPGVGRKTANVVLNVVYGQPVIAVDTHIFRVSNRTGLARGVTPEKVEMKLLRRVPAEFMSHAHHWLILHGRYTCKARVPLCRQCPVVDLCAYKDKNLQPAAIKLKRASQT
ncbi:MAG: endonuclease III [Alphaproteobacteria bacterium]